MTTEGNDHHMTTREKPCTCPKVRHEHGDVRRYTTDGCRCAVCSNAAVRYNKGLKAGHRRMVKPDRAVAHIAELRRLGASYALIAQASGVSTATLLVLAERPLIRPATERKVLAVRPSVAPGHLVPAYRATRRVQALACLGWSCRAIADRIGVARSTVVALAAGADTVRADTFLAIRRLYDELWDHPAPDGADKYARAGRARVINHARRQQWAPPAAWDDIDRDEAPATGWAETVTTVARRRADLDRRNARERAARRAVAA